MYATGSLLAGRYRLEEVVGRGGMSTVYRATDETLGRAVAVKVLLAGLAEQDPTYSARFQREARAAAALGNPEVVTIYDTGLDDGSQYIVMEYVAGHSLEEILRRGQAFEASEAVRIAIAVADALTAAHAAGILHRDIKPANVMLTDSGSVKVLDFGIARRLDGTTITQVASVVGTAAYMAPERALGQPGDERADVYSLGCLLYAMLTGQPPFRGEIAAAVLHQQINADPPPPSQLRPGLAPALDALILETLAKDAAQRPATAGELRDRLTALSGVSADATPAPTAAAPRPVTAATTPLVASGASSGQPLLADHRRRAVVMALATGLITLIAVALLSGGGSASHRASSTHPAGTPHRAATPLRATTSTPSPQTTPSRGEPAKPGPKTQPGQSGTPPGHDATPPGKAKKHGGKDQAGGDGSD